ncbi:serine hydrolase [Altericroceibacterium xinjiangense]|uniref:serine hydrolase n=1 Tax=Altericroceibacterium xinjiangense TaxID=762261 RepID=UPI000F7E3CD0|nr:serine hydrolase [Altericroceibacterium xinjiangense]
MKAGFLGRIAAGVALAGATITSAQARETGIEAVFDSTLGTEIRVPRDYEPDFRSPLEQRIAELADGARGRIGVAAIDLVTGEEVSILGDQRFPMASTSKIAIAATFLEGVDQGRWKLSDRFPLMVPVASRAFSSEKAPVRPGTVLSASQLLELMLTRSSNTATDGLLAVVGGPSAVNDWATRAGIPNFQLTRDIATLVRDDGEIDPAVQVDVRDSTTPRAMTKMLVGLYQGKWLSRSSRNLLIGIMEKCRTGVRRIPALLPDGVTVAHKTGSLNNTSSDVGIVTGADGHAIAVSIYVTGQGSRPGRESKIAHIARALYEGYTEPAVQLVNATYTAK